MSIRVFTSYYRETDSTRRNELITCLYENIQCNAIKNVCLLLENTDAPFSHPKLLTKAIMRRPTYKDLIKFANELTTDPKDNTVICNSDISFNNSLIPLSRVLRSNVCAALSRWDLGRDGTPRCYYTPYSQDAWVFSGKIRDFECNFNIGIPGCDNRFMHELSEVGYKVINPALTIRSYHHHNASDRNYGGDKTKSVAPPYLGMYPHNLHNLPKTIWQNATGGDVKQSWTFDWPLIKRTIKKLLVACRLMKTLKPKSDGNSLAPM
jgi:hypothetical protein